MSEITDVTADIVDILCDAELSIQERLGILEYAKMYIMRLEFEYLGSKL